MFDGQAAYPLCINKNHNNQENVQCMGPTIWSCKQLVCLRIFCLCIDSKDLSLEPSPYSLVNMMATYNTLEKKLVDVTMATYMCDLG